MIAWLRERRQLRGRAAELARWHDGYRTGQRAQPIPLGVLINYRFGQIDEALDLIARAWKLNDWNRGTRTLGAFGYYLQPQLAADDRWWRGVMADQSAEAMALYDRDDELQAWNQTGDSAIVVRMS